MVVEGTYNEETGELKAESIKVNLEENRKLTRTALIEQAPRLEHGDEGWYGTFFSDGQRIQIRPETDFTLKLNKSEKKALREKNKTQPSSKVKKDSSKKEDKDADEKEVIRPLQSLGEIGPNTFMTYEGTRRKDGSFQAARLEFVRNEMERGEARMWKRIAPKIVEPKAEGKPRILKISRIGKFALVANEEAQEYVRRLGQALIPPHQESLLDGDPNKIPFQFFLVKGKVANAFATPNGLIVIYSPMFDVLENEAQLASVIGHEITHSVQEHTRRQMQLHAKKRAAMRVGGMFAAAMGVSVVSDVLALVEGAIRSGYSRKLENQSDRIGLEYLVRAGYDPREAPAVWKQMAKKYGDRPTNFFWSSHATNTTRRSYLMAEIRNNYEYLDYSEFKDNKEEFQRIAELVKQATAKKKKKKKKSNGK